MVKYKPVKDHAERKRISALIERCGKEQTMNDAECRKRMRKALNRAINAKRPRRWKKALKMFERYGARMKGADDE